MSTNFFAQMLSDKIKYADDERLQMMSKALNAYDGHPRRVFKVVPHQPDDNVNVNYSATIVDKGVSFLVGDDLSFEIMPPSERVDTDERAEDRLEELWPSDQRAEDLIDIVTNGGIFGHTYARIMIDAGTPTVLVLDPLNMTMEWAPDNYRKITAYIHQYESTQNNRPATFKEEIRPEPSGQSWRSIFSYCYAGEQRWYQYDEQEWPFAFAPIFHTKNLPKANEVYGKPDLSRYVLALIYYIDRVDSLINRIVRKHTHPKAVARGLKSQDLKLGVDDVLFLPEKEQELSLLEMQGDMAGAMAFRTKLREALAEVSHVPEVATSKVENVGQLSGRAMKILYGPLLDRTRVKRKLYGRMFKALAVRLLEVGGMPEQKAIINWPDPLPNDEKEEAETAVLYKQIGVSDDTLMQRLGFDPDREKEKKQAEGQDAAQTMLAAFNRGGVQPA